MALVSVVGFALLSYSTIPILTHSNKWITSGSIHYSVYDVSIRE
nr:MAG TPA: hypothetical protein [Caudoviricetes sp.]